MDLSELVEIIEDNNLSPRSYIIQLSSSKDLKSLERTINKLGLSGEVNYFSRQLKGKMWHSALFGNYADYASAKEAVKFSLSKGSLTSLVTRNWCFARIFAKIVAVSVALLSPAK